MKDEPVAACGARFRLSSAIKDLLAIMGEVYEKRCSAARREYHAFAGRVALSPTGRVCESFRTKGAVRSDCSWLLGRVAYVYGHRGLWKVGASTFYRALPGIFTRISDRGLTGQCRRWDLIKLLPRV